MKQLLFILTLFAGSVVSAAPVKYVQISTGPTVSLQPGTTMGFFVSSGTAVDLNAIRLRAPFLTIIGTSTFSGNAIFNGTNSFNGGNAFNSWVNFNSSMTFAGSTVAYSPLGIITGTKTDQSTTTTTGNWNIRGSSNAIRGTTSGNPAGPGDYGESLSANFGATNVPTSGQWGNTTSSITLQPGDYLISAAFDIVNNGANILSCNSGIGTAPGNDGTGIENGNTAFNCNISTSAANGAGSTSIPMWPTNIISPTTYYLKIMIGYNTATPLWRGRITALRKR